MQTEYKNANHFRHETGLEFTPHGRAHISNTGGVELMISEDGEAVFYRFLYGQGNIQETEPIYESEIIYFPSEEDEEESEAGFYHGETIYYLNRFIRI